MSASERSRSAGDPGPAFGRRRRAVRVEETSLVRSEVWSETGLPLVLSPATPGFDLAEWVATRRPELSQQLLVHGALLFRGFRLDSPDHFYAVARALCPELLDYRERAAPRVEVQPHVYTSTEFPADQWIPLHHEMSYSPNWPAKVLFYCQTAPVDGGRTPIADDRQILDKIDPAVRAVFAEKNVMYVRNYGEGLDLPWQEAFQTSDRGEVERYCRRLGMGFEWRSGDRLRTTTVRPPTVTHPVTGDELWFNHAHMFHHSNLPAAVRDSLLVEFSEHDLPRNALYGDGTPIPSPLLEEIRQLYRRQAVYFEWQQGDLLLVDNFLVSHGREPFRGPRRILVAMGELHLGDGVAAEEVRSDV